MHVVARDGAWIWFETLGTGPPVVLLHGLADDHDLWRHQVPALSERFTIVSVDTRGHGRSSKRPLPSGMEMLADDVVSVCDAIGAERVAVVGLSMGGGIAQTVALRNPERLWALGLVSTSSAFPPATRRRFLERAEVAEREGMATVVDAMVARWFTTAFLAARHDEVERTRETVVANDPVAFAAASRVNAGRDWTDRLSAIRCPAFYLGGEDDPAAAHANAALFREHIAGIEIHVVEGASHLLPIERPDACTPLLLESLTRAEAKAGPASAR